MSTKKTLKPRKPKKAPTPDEIKAKLQDDIKKSEEELVQLMQEKNRISGMNLKLIEEMVNEEVEELTDEIQEFKDELNEMNGHTANNPN